jgi:hypothetical protein
VFLLYVEWVGAFLIIKKREERREKREERRV